MFFFFPTYILFISVFHESVCMFLKNIAANCLTLSILSLYNSKFYSLELKAQLVTYYYIKVFIFQTCLHIASEHGAVGNIRMLLDHGADLLAKDANGLTALDLAEQGEHTHCMTVLKNAAGMWLNISVDVELIICWFLQDYSHIVLIKWKFPRSPVTAVDLLLVWC